MEEKSEGQWKAIKEEKQCRIMKGQSLNIAADLLIARAVDAKKINIEDFAKLLEESALVIYNKLKSNRWHQQL